MSTPTTPTRAAIYARVSTHDQTCENQLHDLRAYVQARGWEATEFVDTGISGAKDRRPALDALVDAAKRHRFDVVVCWRLDRLGRNQRHLINLLHEWQERGIGFVTLNEGIDSTTAAGRLAVGLLSALAEFERERIRERVLAGLARARREGTKLGRRRRYINAEAVSAVAHLPVREQARQLGVPRGTLQRRLKQAGSQTPAPTGLKPEQNADLSPQQAPAHNQSFTGHLEPAGSAA